MLMRNFYGVLILLMCFLLACNVTKDTELEEALQATPSTEQSTPNQMLSYDQIKNLSTEEQWKHLSPKRRNYLRENPDLYPKFKEMIAANPTMEEVQQTPRVPNNTNQQTTNAKESPLAIPSSERTPEQWWAIFSERRKAYMRKHPEKYPEYEKFLKEE